MQQAEVAYRSSTTTGTSSDEELVGEVRTPSGPLAELAKALNLGGDDVEHLYDDHGGALQVNVEPERLGKNMADQTRVAALLVAGGRQLGGYDNGPTSAAHVLEEIKRLGVHDSSNYSKHMASTTNWFNINKSGRSATYKLKPAGRTALRELANSLTSNS